MRNRPPRRRGEWLLGVALINLLWMGWWGEDWIQPLDASVAVGSFLAVAVAWIVVSVG